MPASTPPFVVTKLVGKDIASKSLTLTGGTITANTPIIDNTITWNDGAVTFTALKLNVTDTASASGSMLLDLQAAGSSLFKVTKAGTATAGGTFITTFGNVDIQTGSLRLGSSADTILTRDAANTFAQRNSTTAQAFRIYNTYTDASNYERASLYWSSNVTRIQTEAAGTGTVRSLAFGSGGIQWYINASGHFLANTDATFDIGASGATRPRHLYVSGVIDAGSHVNCGGSSSFFWNARSRIFSDTDGNIRLSNNGQTDFGRLQFGGTTSSFPALSRSGTAIQARLADDSGRAGLEASTLGLTSDCTVGGKLSLAAGTTGKASATIASGVAPTSPNNGDIWFDGTDLKMRIGGVTKTFTLT